MLKEKLKLIPKSPGCYLMKNSNGTIIYVGKAKNLSSRVKSYFRGKHTGKTKKLVSEITDFEYIVVNSELEAFILELNLIKKYDPKYNILLRDDKSYPYIELTKEKYPRLLIVRNLTKKKNNAQLFGPYPNVKAAREVVNLINRMYPLRKCKTIPKTPCLYYHINQCLGYCFKDIDNKIITNMENEIIEFLKGNHTIVTNKIKLEMNEESERLNFEKALELKELLDYIKIVLQKEVVEINDLRNLDLFGFYEQDNYLSIELYFIRGGKIVAKDEDIIEMIDNVNDEATRYIAYYYKNKLLPTEILTVSFVDYKLLTDTLNIPVTIPKIGDKYKLIEMANNNAKINLENKIKLMKRKEERTIEANNELKELLNLEALDRIEIFDNSNLFGSYNVSGMVVFENGLPKKNEYRKFKITNEVNDDYGTMREVIYRRYYRVLMGGLKRPDLIIVDGGLGQLNQAIKVLTELNLNIPVIGLKKDKKHNTNSIITKDREIKINKQSNLFDYLERMQNEVHNYTISYHKNIRSKSITASILDQIPGIGETRKENLLKKYKNINDIKNASLEELSLIIPRPVAKNLLNKLKDFK
jgi:excinuclease ABC subunit C